MRRPTTVPSSAAVPEAATIRPSSRRVFVLLHAAVVAWLLYAVAGFYEPGAGFTRLLAIAAASHDRELPALQRTPHFDDPSGGYDGQFYAQLALDPLLADPAIDRALDAPAFRARRILLSWTAWLAGLGRPAWVLQAFALQNVAAWLALAWLLVRWFPIGSLRSWCLWSGCLLAHGMTGSVRYALTDGPSLLVVASAVALVETARPWAATLVLGAAGLARETNVLALVLLVPRTLRPFGAWAGAAARAFVALVPLVLWLDYLRAIYRGDAWTGGQVIVLPFVGLSAKFVEWRAPIDAQGFTVASAVTACAVVAFVTQAAYVVWRGVRRDPSPWIPVAIAFALLGLVANAAVWEGVPGAFTRVTLPLVVGFNVAARRAGWPIVILGNLGVIPGVLALMP